MYCMEFVGAFFVGMAALFTNNPLAVGFMYMTVVYLGYHLTKTYYNPAMCVALFVEGQMPTDLKIRLLGAQYVGVFAAQLLFMAITGIGSVPDMAPGVSLIVVSAMECLLTALLVWSLLFARVQNMQNALGFSAIAGIALLSVSSIGGICNPAIGMSMVLVRLWSEGAGSIINYIVPYFVAPLVGGAVGAYAYKFFAKASWN